MSNVLVAYASAHESTKGIATEIGERLTMANHCADVRPVDAVDGLHGHDAVVLGSAIHNGKWLPPAAAFVYLHAAELASRPVWLFSVSSVGETSSFFGPRVSRLARRMRKETTDLAGFRKAVRPCDHRHFAGAVEPSHWGRLGNLFLRAVGGTNGDHRDWKDIDAWADGIARALSAVTDARQDQS